MVVSVRSCSLYLIMINSLQGTTGKLKTHWIFVFGKFLFTLTAATYWIG